MLVEIDDRCVGLGHLQKPTSGFMRDPGRCDVCGPPLGSPSLEHIAWSPVSGFKGLEKDVVIVAGTVDLPMPKG